MTRIRRKSKKALMLGAVTLMAGGASASTIINLDTGTADWRLSNFTPTHAGHSSGVASGTFGVFGTSAPVISRHNAWKNSLDGEAKWIGPKNNATSFGGAGLYEYTLDLSGVLTPGNTYSFDVDYIADNGLVGAFYNTESQTVLAPADARDFEREKSLTFSFVADAFSVLKVQIYNADNTGMYGPKTGHSASDTANPTGFILSGQLMETNVPVVPEPSMLGMLSVLGLAGIRRWR